MRLASLLTAFALTAGCLDMEGEGGDDETGATNAEMTRPVYYVDPGNRSGVSSPSWDCTDWRPNAVVRAWRLMEKNAYDFYHSKQSCREIRYDGTLASTGTLQSHFFVEGANTLGVSAVPLDRVPVGIRYYWRDNNKRHQDEIKDGALIYMSAADVLDNVTEPDGGYDYALGRTGPENSTMRCKPGSVLVGIRADATDDAARGARRIKRLGIGCAPLRFGRP